MRYRLCFGVLLPLGLLALVKRRPLFSALLLPRQR
jgi:hypothetical protein